MAGSTFAVRKQKAMDEAAAAHIQAIARGRQARRRGEAGAAIQDLVRRKSMQEQERRKSVQQQEGSSATLRQEAVRRKSMHDHECRKSVQEQEGSSASLTHSASTASFLMIDLSERSQLQIGHISEMPKILLAIMARHRSRIQELFKTLDSNHDGLIELNEFETALTGIGFEVPREGDLELLFKAIDTSGEGTVSFDEIEAFCRAVRRGHQLLEPEPEAERRKRLGLDEIDRLKAAKAAEAERRQRERDEVVARAAAQLAEMRKKEAQRAAAEMAAWLARAEHENQRRYEEMLAAAMAMLPGGASNKLGNGAGNDEAVDVQPLPPWSYYPMPRVERAGFPQPMAFRAKPQPRHASVAFPSKREISSDQWRGFTTRGLSRPASAATLGRRDAPTRPQLTRNASASLAYRPSRPTSRPSSGKSM